MKKYAVIILALLFVSCGRESQFDIALESFHSGDYETAMIEFKKLAKDVGINV